MSLRGRDGTLCMHTPPHLQEDLDMHSHTTGGCCGRSRKLTSAITLRHARTEDATALRRLAALDSSPAPSGETLVAEHDGTLVAAITLDGRTAIGDPFVPTAAILALLRTWSAQFQVAA
jgi:hypothetical protein